MPLPALALLGAAGISALGSIGGSLMASKSNSDAAKETNALAREQFNQNMAFQKYQYENTKQYNSYENQVRMMRNAGLNPSLQFGSGASPVGASSVGGVAPTASQVTPDYSFLPSALSNAANAFSDVALNQASISKLNADTQGQQIDNLYKDEFWNSSNMLRNAQSNLFSKQAQIAELQASFDSQSLGDRLFQQKWQSELTRAHTEAMLISNAYLPERCSQEISSLITNQKVAVMNGKASVKSAMAAVMQAINQKHAFDAQYGGNPAQRAQFFNKTLESLHEASELSRSNQYKNWLTPTFNTIGTSIPHPIGGFVAGSTAERSSSYRHAKKR